MSVEKLNPAAPAVAAFDHEAAVDAVHDLLRAVGEDPNRPGLRGTPERVARAWAELLSGHHSGIDEIVGDAVFEETGSGLVAVTDIPFHSLCEHHLLPFMGHVHIAYQPRTQVLGLSKLPRLVGAFSRRLQLQERLTGQIAQAVMDAVQPEGVVVVATGVHLCATMRGVRAGNASMTTQAVRGRFHTHPDDRDRALRALGLG